MVMVRGRTPPPGLCWVLGFNFFIYGEDNPFQQKGGTVLLQHLPVFTYTGVTRVKVCKKESEWLATSMNWVRVASY